MSTAFQWTCGSCTYQNVVPDRTKSVVQCKMCGQTSQLQFGPPPATPPAPLPTPPVQPPRPTPTPTPAPKSEPKKQDPWTCTVCTYQNTLSNIKACVMCQAPRASVTPPSQPTPTPTPAPVATPPMYGVPGGVSPPGGFGFPQPTPTPQPQPTPQPTYPAGGYPTPQPVVGQPPVAGYQPYVVGYDAQGRPIMSQPPVATTPPQPQPQPVPTPTPTPTPQPTPTPPVQPGLPPGMMTIAHADGRLMMVPAPPGHPQHIPQVYAPYAQALGYPVPPTVGAGLPAQPTPQPTPTPTPTPQPTVQPTYGVPSTAAGGVILTGGPAGSPPAGYPGYPQPTPQPTPQPVVGNGQGASPYLMDPSLVGGFAPVGGVVATPPAQPQPVPTPAVSPPSSSFGAPHGSPTVNPQASPISMGGDFGVDGKRGVPSPSGSSAPFSLEGMGLPASHAAMRPAVAPTPTPAPTPSPAQSAADAFAGSAAAALRDINHQGPPVALTPEQKKLFVRQGYVVIPGVVPKSRVQAALRAINHDMGKGVSRDDAIKAKATTWCPSLMPMPVITNLFNASNAIQLVSSVLGQPCPAVTAGQIALRHPGTLCTDPVTFTPVPWWDKGWHIDGFHSKDNGIPKGSIRNFTCLVGVLLNDIPSEMSGNLAVYPRSHLVLQDYFRTNGFEKVKEGLDSLPRLPLSKPVQITGNAGDLVICHYQLAHTIAPNVSPNIRYAAYFRITSPSMKTQSLPPVPDVLKDGADAHRPESMLNIWKDWPGLAPYLDAEGEREGISEIKDGEGGQRPFYGDEVARVEDEKAAEEDRRRAVVQEQADKLFEAHKWLECQSIWTQLAQEQPHDYVIQFKAGCVHTWSPREDAETLRQGEDFLQKAATLCPVYPNVYAVLAHNRLRQGRHKEAVAAVKQMLACPYKEGEDRTIVDALKHARDSLVKLDQVNQLDGMLKQARATYPHLGAQFDEIMVGVEGEQTWVQCKAWLDSPTKSFPHGEALFRKLVSLKPTDYWANWLLGGVLTWEGKREKCIQGQPFIAEALTINPALPHGYQLMAQNLMIQGKPQEAVAQVQAMLAQPLEDIATNDGHAQKIIEALNTVFKVLGKSSPEFQSLLTTAQSSYPSLLPRLAQFQ